MIHDEEPFLESKIQDGPGWPTVQGPGELQHGTLDHSQSMPK